MAPRRKCRRLGQRAKKKGLAQGGRPLRNASMSSSASRSTSRSTDEDSSSDGGGSDEDDPRDYKRGGYHPVTPYQLYNSRYRVLSKLGAGNFSTVWLCADEKDQGEDGPELVAMKVCKSKKSVTEQALDEVLLLERLQDDGMHSPHVVQMRGHFWHSGPNGRHKCMVFEVMGENLLALVKHHDYNGLPLPTVRRLARHTLIGLEYIHSHGVIHTDVKLENVLVQRHDLMELMSEARQAHRAFMEQRSGLVALSKSQKKKMKKKEKKNAKAKANGAEGETRDGDSDGGEATVEAEDNGGKATNAAEIAAADQAAAEACGRPVPPVRQFERFKSLEMDQVFAKLADFGNGCRVNRKVTDDIQTRQYRSPEVILGAEWDETADVWSAACMFFELITGDFLFDPRTGEDWSRDEDHLALMIELLGEHPPKEWALSGKYSRDFFSNSGKLKHIKNLRFWSLTDVLSQKYAMPVEEAAEVTDFLIPMLRWEPRKRQTAAEALKHRWVSPNAIEASSCGDQHRNVFTQVQETTSQPEKSGEAASCLVEPVANVTPERLCNGNEMPSQVAVVETTCNCVTETGAPLAPTVQTSAPEQLEDCGEGSQSKLEADENAAPSQVATAAGGGSKKKNKKKGKK